MTNEEIQCKCLFAIKDSLDRQIDSDYILIDVPNHRNIGDHLILRGELDYFRTIRHKMLLMTDLYSYKFEPLPRKVTIVLHGGGNFGDLYPVHQKFRLEVVRRYPNNKIVMLPQTVCYRNAENLEKDARVLRAHTRLVVYARDAESYGVLSGMLPGKDVFLLPDLAMFLDKRRMPAQKATEACLFLQRTDRESDSLPSEIAVIGEGQKISRYFVSDWPTYFKTDLLERFVNKYCVLRDRFVGSMLPKLPNRSLIKIIYSKMLLQRNARYVRRGVLFFSRFRTIYTTRLHGLILGFLLGKKVVVVDNKYNKSTNYYRTWLSCSETIVLFDRKHKVRKGT